MKTIVSKLNIHTPWYIYRVKDVSYYMQNNDAFLNETHCFSCGEICDIEISNAGLVKFIFKTDTNEKQAREYCAIFLYFISICNGFNCEFDTTAYVDNQPKVNFFSYAKEDETDLPLLKDKKFYEIALGDIKEEFGDIINKLFSTNKLFMLSLLSNYYSMVVYKDFIGNGTYKFRNIVANIESIITIINEEKYRQIENKNKEYFKKVSNDSKISKRQLNKHLTIRRIPLKDKVEDVFKCVSKFGLEFKLNYNDECEKIANTRNFISHLFDEDKKYLSEQEQSKYTAVFEEIFRMLFLEYCGVDTNLIREKFLKNTPIKITLNNVFNIK